MAKQPETIQPFRPFSSGAKKKPAIEVVDDRRTFYGDLSGVTQGNEVLLVPTGAWPVVTANAPQLQEVLRCTLKRPEPVTVYFHPWLDTSDRFRQSIKFFAHASSAVSALEQLQGRVFIEWGVGSARNYTYCDLAPGSLHIPACQWIAVSGWIHSSVNVRLAASMQIGYPHSESNCNWTAILESNAVMAGYTVQAPNFARELTGFMYSTDPLAETSIAFQQFLALPAQYWLLRPAITPNPQTIPYPPVKVPISVGLVVVLTMRTPGPTAPVGAVGSVLTLRI